jgi:3-hydroxyacyl-CoA dehydrogenase/enoyl-CoA hydratase/carnithine racemase
MSTKEATLTLSHAAEDIPMLTFDVVGKGANVLSQSVLLELANHLETLAGVPGIAGLIIRSGKPGQFIAGADLREFLAAMSTGADTSVTYAMCRQGQKLFERLSQLPFPTVAAIDGICVGGGAELASWCDRRIVTSSPKTQFGFPEVKLGLYPGWGGTVRAPRIVGLSNAIEMIAGGEPLTAAEAFKMGWASDIVPLEKLVDSAVRLIRREKESGEYLRDRKRWAGNISLSDTDLAFLGATSSAFIQQQSKGQYPAPMAALETILAGAGMTSDAACDLEAKGMAKLFGSPINRALLNIFFLTDRNKKDTGVGEGVVAKEIAQMAVIGAGIMGAGIAAANLKRDARTVLTDSNEEALARGARNVLEEVSFQRETKGKDPEKAIKYAAQLVTTQSLEIVAQADLVIEAVVENLEVKRKLYAEVEPRLRSNAFLASNTSTIPISKLAEGLKHPERFCGIHFFNPVRRMKLVEVIRGRKTDDVCVATAVKLAKGLGKFPIVVEDGPGFLVNRLLLPYMDEATKLLEEGNSIDAIDKAAKSFGMPMGPIELYDMVGLDTAVFAGKVLCDAFPTRFQGSQIVPALVAAGRLGTKNGRGFFSYENKKQKKETDPSVQAILLPHCDSGGKALSKDALTHRLFLPMVTEATRILEEKLVRDPRDVDLGLIFGVGFPPFRGGLLFWADSLGADKIVEMLRPFEHLGERYCVTPLLKELATSKKKFYDLGSLQA